MRERNRPVLTLRPGDRVRQPSGAMLTVAARPQPAPQGSRLTWTYIGGSTGTAHWLDRVPCLPVRPSGEGGEGR